MTDQAEPGRPPAHDIAAFDLNKRSPEQLAQSFARWKAQRKRPPEKAGADAPAGPTPLPTSTESVTDTASPGDKAPKHVLSKAANPVQYSTPFSALLAAGSEPTVQRAASAPITPRPSSKRSDSPGRRLKAMSAVAGAASVFALAGGALLELSDWRGWTEAAPEVAPVHRQAIPMAAPIAAVATRAPATEWALQHTVDLALMKAMPNAEAAVRPTPEPPTVQTASKPASASAESTPAPSPPTRGQDTPEPVQFVAKPFIPGDATPASTPAAQGTSAPPVAAAVRSGDPRPDALFQHGQDSASGNGTAGNRLASGGMPAEATGAPGGVDAQSITARSTATRTATARTGTVTSGSNGDPRGEGTGGARAGSAIDAGAGSNAGGASDVGGGNAGEDGAADGGSGAAVGGDAGGADPAGAGGGDAGGADPAGVGGGGAGSADPAGAGGGDAGGADPTGAGGNAGGADPASAGGGDAGSGDPNSGDSGDGESGDDADGDSGGIGGAIKGALGGIGDALGDAVGGDSNQADGEDE